MEGGISFQCNLEYSFLHSCSKVYQKNEQISNTWKYILGKFKVLTGGYMPNKSNWLSVNT